MIAAGLAIGAVSASAASIAWSIRTQQPDVEAEASEDAEKKPSRAEARATKAKAPSKKALSMVCKVAAVSPECADETCDTETVAPATRQSSFAETVLPSPAWTPAEILEELQRGNERFRTSTGTRAVSKRSEAIARAAAKLVAAADDGVGQQPGAVTAGAVEAAAAVVAERRPAVAVLLCGGQLGVAAARAAGDENERDAGRNDAHCEAREIFDAGLGELLAIPVGGGVADGANSHMMSDGAWNALQHAAHELQVKVVVVLGTSAPDLPGSTGQGICSEITGVVEQLAGDEALMERVRNLDLMIIGARCDVATNAITFFHEVSGYCIADKNFARRPCRGVQSCYTPPPQQGTDCLLYEKMSSRSSQDISSTWDGRL